jgi:hypothetical protein
MLENFIYKNPPDAGLGDRILDIITLYSYSELLNYKNFYVYWSVENISTRQCLSLNYFNHFIELPKNIHLISKEKLNEMCCDCNNYVFNDCLGATSLFLFKEKYNLNEETFTIYKKLYFECFNKIVFKNIPDQIKTVFEENKNISTIHLRRTDKVNNVAAAHGVDNNELIFLENKTHNFIKERSNNNCKICIISDDKQVKDHYVNLYNNRNDINLIYFDFQDEAIQTIIDYYCLINSNEIFMSQKFSTFSITSSLIKNNTLYYCFNYGRMFCFDNIEYHFNEYPNFILY